MFFLRLEGFLRHFPKVQSRLETDHQNTIIEKVSKAIIVSKTQLKALKGGTKIKKQEPKSD